MSDRPYKTLTAYRFRHVTPDSPFYERVSYAKRGTVYQIGFPKGWAHKTDEFWSYYFPPMMSLPDQGWKIHLSAVLGKEMDLLLVVSQHLFSRGTPFKHLVSESVFLQSNSKYADRGSSGKFITIYPKDDDDFCALLEELEKATGHFDGPYILSDTKYKEGPVYFRYGGFKYSFISESDGITALAIHDKNGTPIKDAREAWFVVPPFVAVPKMIKGQVNSRLHPDKTELARDLYPFRVERSLHFSNGGGVYLAVNETDGSRVVLKEARKYAGYTSKTEDACVRLKRERDVLQRLSGRGFVPEMLEYFSVEDHEFLAESYVEGITLQSWIASKYPLSLDAKGLNEYCNDASMIRDRIIKIVETVHETGLALMDINPRNFIVSSDLRVSLVDFEGFRELRSSDVGVLGTPGFMPLVACSNIERDSYGLVCLLLYLYLPSWTNSFSPETLFSRLSRIAELFPPEACRQINVLFNAVPEKLLKPRDGYYQLKFDESPSLNNAISYLVSGVIAMRLAGKEERRLYPGDATQFMHGELGMLDIETGAAGVALMLSRAGVDSSIDASWILERLRHQKSTIRFHGLLRGGVGIACALAQMGFGEEAIELLPADLPDLSLPDISIRSGISGTVLSLLEICRRTNSDRAFDLLRAASKKLASLIDAGRPPQSPASETGNAFGLFDGWFGAAVACRELSFFLEEKRSEWLDRMERSLDLDLKEMSLRDDGGRYINYSGVNFSYLSEGSAGALFALALCSPAKYQSAMEQIEKTLTSNLTLNGTLFHGRGGIVVAFLAAHGADDLRTRSMLNDIESNFLFRKADKAYEWYMLGNGGACLSADYSSGSVGLIGVLLSMKEGPTRWFPTSLYWSTASMQERKEV